MKIVFSAFISIVLLLIYVYLVIKGIIAVNCVNGVSEGCAPNEFNSKMASSLSLIGGLVTALVIAELSITKPGEAPAARLIAPEMQRKSKLVMQIVTGMYLLVWLFTGLSAYLFGYLLVDETKSIGDNLHALSDLGQAWLGVAVGAGYAYFGVK